MRRLQTKIMSTLSELKSILRKFGEESDQQNMRIKVNKNVKQLLEQLEEELYIKVLDYGTNEATINIKSSTKWFVLSRTINARRNELLQWATLFLPTIGGSLIVFTRMGVKTHHDAIQCRIGGQIIGFVF